MPRFHVRDAFALQDKKSFVLAGFVIEGEVAAGMLVRIPFTATVMITAEIDHIQFIRRPDGDRRLSLHPLRGSGRSHALGSVEDQGPDGRHHRRPHDPMTTYIIRRLLLLIPTLFGITLLTFLLIRLAPGNAALLKGGGGRERRARHDGRGARADDQALRPRQAAGTSPTPIGSGESCGSISANRLSITGPSRPRSASACR